MFQVKQIADLQPGDLVAVSSLGWGVTKIHPQLLQDLCRGIRVKPARVVTKVTHQKDLGLDRSLVEYENGESFHHWTHHYAVIQLTEE